MNNCVAFLAVESRVRWSHHWNFRYSSLLFRNSTQFLGWWEHSGYVSVGRFIVPARLLVTYADSPCQNSSL